jgi:hypothetical protein
MRSQCFDAGCGQRDCPQRAVGLVGIRCNWFPTRCKLPRTATATVPASRSTSVQRSVRGLSSAYAQHHQQYPQRMQAMLLSVARSCFDSSDAYGSCCLAPRTFACTNFATLRGINSSRHACSSAARRVAWIYYTTRSDMLPVPRDSGLVRSGSTICRTS